MSHNTPVFFSTKMLQFDIWQIAVPHLLPITVSYLNCSAGTRFRTQ